MSVAFSEEFVGNGLLKIALAGSLDAPGAMSLEEQFQERLLAQGGDVIVDLGALEFMSSYGLRMLLIAAKALYDKQRALHLAAPQPHVRDVIQVAGYDSMFPVHDTVEAAIAELTG